MGHSSREFIRVPPDGAGKALLTDHVRVIDYIAGVNGVFTVGATVVGATSSTSAVISQINPVTGVSGQLIVHFAHTDLDNDFQVGENLEVDNVVGGQVAASEDFHVSQTQIVGSNNPRFAQQVDVEGAASVRFSSGVPLFDAAGRTEVSEEKWVGIYQHVYDEQPDLISTTTAGLGSITYDAASSTTELQVDDGASDSVIRQTHLYHNYRPGVPMTVFITVAAGAAIANCTRRWGYFDSDNGLFFEYDGSQLYVVIRSSATGSMVETRVPQSQWNGDRLDGSGDLQTNPSGRNLTAENFWLYTISFLHLGAGPAMFAVYTAGRRIVLHTFNNDGQSAYPFMATGTLPLRWEIFNTGATSGPAQMRQGSATVHTLGDWAPQEKLFSSKPRTPVSVAGPTAIGVIRAKQTHASGADNRSVVFPTEMRIYTSAQPIHVMITRGGDFTISDWFTETPESLLEQGTYLATPGDWGTAQPPAIVSTGTPLFSHIIVPGEVGFLDLAKAFSVRSDGEIRRDADITQATKWAVIAQSLDGTTPTDVTVTLSWREVY